MKKISPIWLIFSLSFTVSHGIPGLIPLLALMTDVFQVTPTDTTLLLSYFSLAALGATPIWGYLATHIQRSTMVYIIIFIHLFSGIASAFATSFDELLIYRIFQGCGSAGMNILIAIFPAEYYKGKERARVMGVSFAFVAIGLFTMPLMSGYIAHYSWSMALLSLQIPTIIPLIVYIFTDKTPKYEPSMQKYNFSDYKNVFLSPEALSLVIVYFLLSGIDLALPSIIALFATEKFGFSSSDIGALYSLSNIGLIIGSAFLMNRLSPLSKFPYILLFGGICAAISLSFILQVDTALLMGILLFIYFTQSGIMQPFINYSMTTIAPPALLAGVMTLLMMSMRLGQGLLTIVFSYIAQVFGYNTAFYSAIVSYLVMLSILFCYTRFFRYRLECRNC